MEKNALRAQRRRTISTSGTFSELMQSIRRSSSRPSICTHRSDEDGHLIQPVDIPSKLTSYYRGVYSQAQGDQQVSDQDLPIGQMRRLDYTRLFDAGRASRRRFGRALGRDGTSAELLKSLSWQQLEEFFALAASPDVPRPDSWNTIPVRLLPKSSGIELYANRLIALQSASHKLYMTAMQRVILEDIQHSLDPLMGGHTVGGSHIRVDCSHSCSHCQG